MEFSSAIYRGDPCPEFSFSFKSSKKLHKDDVVFTIPVKFLNRKVL